MHTEAVSVGLLLEGVVLGFLLFSPAAVEISSLHVYSSKSIRVHVGEASAEVMKMVLNAMTAKADRNVATQKHALLNTMARFDSESSIRASLQS